jgi:serpin B
MVKRILNQIPDTAVMYLINALAFDAEWQNIYEESQIRSGTFTTESGNPRDVEMMYGSEYQYLDDGNATGFVKYYAGHNYAFVALLPNKGLSLENYVASLSGNGLRNTLQNVQNVQVKTAIPKFESEYSVEMSDILKSMGLTDAFDSNLANFTGLGEWKTGNLFINQVIHKTNITVDEKGTKAGAATAVEVASEAACIQEELKTVYLDRPFVYMLIDCDTNLPFFIGTVMDTDL